MARSWYAYNGTGDPIVPSSYNISFFKPTCINGNQICAIYATGTGPAPSFLSTNIRGYIADVQLTLVAKPNSGSGIKKYVYGKMKTGC